MNTRQLNDREQENLDIVKSAVGEFALLFVTETGLRKSILDATLPLRTLLKDKSVHDFSNQPQGPDNKVVLPIRFASGSEITSSRCSFYRPITKQGDSRLWPYGLADHCRPNEVFAVFCFGGLVYFLNLTSNKLAPADDSQLYSQENNRFSEQLLSVADALPIQNHAVALLNSIASQFSSTANYLLNRLREIANRGPLESVCEGDTSVGRSIETALGIQINSNKNPDFQGIEIKSFRSTKPKTGLITLFSKTPDWTRSQVKNSRDYLALAGYNRNGMRRLYCSVFATQQNSLKLQLNLNQSANDLEEIFFDAPKKIIAVWGMNNLHNEFRRKHNETFWVSAETEKVQGKEQFRLKSVIHTQKPLVTQFDSLIVQGQICLDHTIKEKDGRVVDKGYLFRIRSAKMPELFAGTPRRYALI